MGTLLDGGCNGATVVLGAQAASARALVPDFPDVAVVETNRWELGISASLEAGLAALEDDRSVEAALITLVDLPSLPVAAVARILGLPGNRRHALAQATYTGRPGHPVLIGRGHWEMLRAQLRGDRGASVYLRSASILQSVECSDLWDGEDQDRPVCSASFRDCP